MFLQKSLIFICAFTLSFGVFAQSYFRSLGPDEGLAGYETHDMIQDNEGYLWIATDQGLSKFDGQHFVNYDTEDGLPDLVILHLSLMPDGSILGITLNNRLFICQGDSIRVFPEEYKLLNRIRQQDIPQFLEVNDDGKIAYGGNQSGYVAVSDENSSNRGHQNSGHGIWLDRNGTDLVYGAWLVDEDKNDNNTQVILGHQDSKSLLWADVPYTTSPLRAIELKNGSMLIAYAGFTCIIDSDGNMSDTGNFGKQINCIYEDENANLWVGHAGGLNKYDSAKDFVDGKPGTSFISSSVSCIHFDKDKALWIGTLNEGIKYLPQPEIVICSKTISHSWKSIRPLGSNRLLAIASNDELYEIEWSPENIEAKYIEDKNVRASCLNRKNNLLVVGRDAVLELKDNGSWAALSPEPKQCNCLQALSILSISENEYGICERRGFEILNKQNGKLLYDSRQDGFIHRTYAMLRDSKGTLWLGTNAGFFRKGKSDFEKINEVAGIPIIGRVEFIERINGNRLAIALKGQGLLICSEDMQEANLYTQQNGLRAGIIRFLSYYDEHGLIVGGSKGMDRLNVSDNEIEVIEHIDKWNGLPSNEVIECHIFEDYYWFVCPDGIARLPFNANKKSTPGLDINYLKVDNQLFYSDPLEALPYETGVIRIKYTGFYYEKPEDLIYRYQLKGRDSTWNSTSADMLEFSSLDPGKYKLIIQAGTKDLNWGESSEITFKISTPYWRTWWFITLLVIAISGLLYLIITWLLKRLRKGDIIEKKLVHLERSALLAQMNPHFIFNSLNSIQSYIANNENDKANRFLAKFSRLIRAMLNHSRSPKVSLQEEINSLELYLELEKMRFKGKFEFEINVDPDIDTHDIELPPLLIQPYLENAIIHGLAKKDGVGRIELFYMLMGKYLVATVTDNGIGIEQSKQMKENSSSLHKSVGMTITQKRLELLDENNKDKKVNIEEVKDRHGKVLGTKVEVKIRVID